MFTVYPIRYFEFLVLTVKKNQLKVRLFVVTQFFLQNISDSQINPVLRFIWRLHQFFIRIKY
jgi:hypothetical protein